MGVASGESSTALDYVGGRVTVQNIGLEGADPKTVSPYHQAELIKAPMLIIQAEDDAVVTIEQGRRMASKLDRLGKSVKFVEVPFGGHDMMNEPARLTILQSLDEFLDWNIGGR